MKFRIIAIAVVLALVPAAAYAAGTTLFSPRIGDVFIDGVVPSAAPSATTATAASGAATLNRLLGEVTSESITTAAGSDYVLTLTNSAIAATDTVLATVRLGTATTGEPAITSVTPSAGQVVINVRNIAASAAFNGTIVIGFVSFKN